MIMRYVFAPVGLITFSLFAQAQVKSLGRCDGSFDASLEPGSRLSMHLRSGDINITGTSEPKIVVTCSIDGPNKHGGDVQVKYMASGKSADLKVSGGPMDRFHLRIQVPGQTNLLVRSTAGDMTIDNVVGHKDASLSAGDLTIAVGSAADYSRAEASVHVGGLEAQPWSVQKGGFFRSFKQTNPTGKYYLNAHVGAGGITLH